MIQVCRLQQLLLLDVVLWDESGYFDTTAEIKPLLHLWSLGIEEQFYIFWPLILWAAWKWFAPNWLLSLTGPLKTFTMRFRARRMSWK